MAGGGRELTFWRCPIPVIPTSARGPEAEVTERAAKRTPISRPESRAISNLRKRIALILCNNAGHLHFYRLSPRPFSHSVGCELNRTRHPSGSSVPRCSATALVACATPEKLWCQAVSKGLLAVPMAIAAMTTPVLQWLMAWAIQHSVFMQMAQRRRPNQSARFTPVRFPGSPPLAKPLSETQAYIEGLLVSQHVVAGSRQLVRQSLDRQDAVRLALLAFIKTLGPRTVA